MEPRASVRDRARVTARPSVLRGEDHARAFRWVGGKRAVSGLRPRSAEPDRPTDDWQVGCERRSVLATLSAKPGKLLLIRHRLRQYLRDYGPGKASAL